MNEWKKQAFKHLWDSFIGPMCSGFASEAGRRVASRYVAGEKKTKEKKDNKK